MNHFGVLELVRQISQLFTEKNNEFIHGYQSGDLVKANWSNKMVTKSMAGDVTCDSSQWSYVREAADSIPASNESQENTVVIVDKIGDGMKCKH